MVVVVVVEQQEDHSSRQQQQQELQPPQGVELRHKEVLEVLPVSGNRASRTLR